MHDVLRQRIIRRLETLPEGQLYQALDYIEFLESKYGNKDLPTEVSGLQRFAENMEDKLRKKAMSPQTLREAFQLIAAADRVLSSVSSAGKQIVNELGSLSDVPTDGRGGSDARGGVVEGERERSAAEVERERSASLRQPPAAHKPRGPSED